MTTMGHRRKSREILLQLLFQVELNFEKDPNILLKGFLVDFKDEKDMKTETYDRAQHLFFDILNKKEELDQLIEKFSEHWKIHRMSHVDRNILRAASYELLYCKDIPAQVILDEAIEIAKRYGAEDSGSFVNGILDKIWKNQISL